MLGMADPWIALVWLLTIGTAATCVLYGLVNWNKGAGE